MNFAPYRDDIPSDASTTQRESLLPKPAPSGSKASAATSAASNLAANITRSVPWFSSTSYQSGAQVASIDGQSASSSSGTQPQQQYQNMRDSENQSSEADAYVTRFGTRVDLEAALAYFLGPVLAILLLILETHNSYVRFHAYQSLLLSAGLAVLHLILIWSTFLTRTLFAVDVVGFWYLALMAFRDAETLHRLKLPHVGDLADDYVAQE